MSKSRSVRDRRIHVERHKRWGTPSVYMAEWLVKSVEYCQSVGGKQDFEDWVRKRYGDQADEKLSACYAGPKRLGAYRTLNEAMFNKAATPC